MSSWNWQADKDDVSSAAACFGALKHPRKMLLSDPSGSDLTGVPFSICYPFDSSFYLRSVQRPNLCYVLKSSGIYIGWRGWGPKTPGPTTMDSTTKDSTTMYSSKADPMKTIQRWRRTIGMTDDCPYDNQKVPHSTGPPNQLSSSQLVYYGSDVPSAIGLVHLDLIFMWNLQLVALALRI